MRHGSLFNGIGGFQLAAHWMGWENIFHCEIDKFCNQVVKRHFPESICYEDIKKTDFTPWKGAIDILTGGFPCQPYSVAGKRKGNKDDRHLWPEMCRAIAEIQPRWVVGENVPGLVNWGDGMVFQQIQTDMETEGYEVFPPIILPACGKEAPHERSRCWIIAYAGRNGHESGGFTENRCQEIEGKGVGVKRERLRHDTWRNGKSEATANNFKIRFSTEEQVGELGRQRYCLDNIGNSWAQFPTQSGICGRNDGIPNRVDRVAALGNAIVPQVALEIFKAIEAFENP